MISQKHHKNLRLLIDGQNSFKQIIKRIREAKKTIHINIFIWRDDKIGNIIGEELLKAANRGVKIHISKDKLGAICEKAEENKQSFFHKSFNLRFWFKQKFTDFFNYTPGEAKDCRQHDNELVDSLVDHKNVNIDKSIVKWDHSKFYIFDNRYIIMGGMNIEDRAIYHDVTGQKWNDYMIEMEGTAFVKRLKERLNGKKRNKDALFDFVLNLKGKIENFEIKSTVLSLLSLAKKKVNIQMAYFGDKDVTNKLIEIANKGIDVTILLPKRPNLQKDLNYKVMMQIILKTKNRVRVYLCRNMLHAKMIAIDEEIILLGSANLNKLAINQFSELDILIADDLPFTNLVRASIRSHIKNSELVQNLDQIKYNRLRAFLESLG